MNKQLSSLILTMAIFFIPVIYVSAQDSQRGKKPLNKPVLPATLSASGGL